MCLRYIVSLVCVIALMVIGQHAQAIEKRTALVIGNSDYKNSPLRNPINDAKDIAAILESVGFNVIFRSNLSQAEMRSAIRKFGDQIKMGGTGLFYYAGHGMQIDNVNYLIPVGSDIRAEDEVPDQSIEANLVLKKMNTAGNRLNIVILDACRNNPFARSFRSSTQGLARMDGPTGTLIAYATAPDSVSFDGHGRNGVYTKHLLKNIAMPGVSLERVFQRVRKGVIKETDGVQTPWESTSLTDAFYFRQTENKPISPNAEVRNTDISFWESVQGTDNPDKLKSYVQRFPQGLFVSVARSRLDELTGRRVINAVSDNNNDDATLAATEEINYLGELKGSEIALALSKIRINQPSARLVFTPDLVKGAIVQQLRVDEHLRVMPNVQRLRAMPVQRAAGSTSRRLVLSGDVTAYGERLEYNASVFKKKRWQIATVQLKLQLQDLVTGEIVASGHGKSERKISVTQTILGTGVSRGTNPTLANDALEAAVSDALHQLYQQVFPSKNLSSTAGRVNQLQSKSDLVN